MGVRRYNTLTPTTGLATFPTSVMEDRKFLGLFFDRVAASVSTSAIDITNEQIDVDGTEDGLFRLLHVPKGQANDLIGGARVLDIWSGPSKTGTQFTAITGNTAFGPATSREFRHYVGSNEIDVDPDQIADGGFTTLYATYKASHSEIDPELFARLWEEVQATQNYVIGGTSSSSTIPDSFAATSGEALVKGFGYVDAATKTVFQFDDPRDLAQVEALVWVDGSVNSGANFTAYLTGLFEKPASITAYPIGKAILAGRNGLPTWDEDGSANALVAGDFARISGRSMDGTNLFLSLVSQSIRGV